MKTNALSLGRAGCRILARSSLTGLLLSLISLRKAPRSKRTNDGNLNRMHATLNSTLRISLLPVLAIITWMVAAYLGTAPAHAWGRLGHRVISRLAEQRLTYKAKAGITALLPEGE